MINCTFLAILGILPIVNNLFYSSSQQHSYIWSGYNYSSQQVFLHHTGSPIPDSPCRAWRNHEMRKNCLSKKVFFWNPPHLGSKIRTREWRIYWILIPTVSIYFFKNFFDTPSPPTPPPPLGSKIRTWEWMIYWIYIPTVPIYYLGKSPPI